MALAFPLVSCTTDDDEMNSSAGQTGTPSLESVCAGNERVQITWKPNDSAVEGSYIYWNSGADSEYVYFTAGTEEITTVITIEPGEYAFYVQNVLADETLSTASSSITTEVYDTSYASAYDLCPFIEINYDGEFGGMITWGEADDCVGNMVYYEDYDGTEFQVYCPIEDGTSYMPGAAINTNFTYVSYYVPVEGGIDSLATDPSDGTDLFEAADGFLVNSIDAFIPYLSRDNVHVKLVEGTYQVGPDDVKEKPELYGNLQQTSTTTLIHTIFQLTGSGSTYDFNNSTIEFDNNVMNTLDYMIYTFMILGNNNTIKNGTLQQVGDLETYPLNGANFISVDGRENYLENITVMPRGSYPWGYGELFGKGTTSVIAHYKNGGILVRGESNHLYDCHVIQRALCHGIFIQGAYEPIIENCTVESLMITSDEVLDDTRSQYDEGSNGRPRAYDVGYLTDFWDDTICPYSSMSDCSTYCDVGNDHNYIVQPGFVLSLMEDGIRTYNNSGTIVDGVYYEDGEHDTRNVTIKDCTVKHARGGITTPLQSGWTVVENCTTIGNDRGIAVGNNGSDVVSGCYSDFHYGTAFNIDYNSAKTQTVEITLIDAGLPERINGYKAENNVGYAYTSNGSYVWPSESIQKAWTNVSGVEYAKCSTYQDEGTEGKIRQIAFIQGTGHDITFHASADFDDDYYAEHGEYIIKIGGDEEIMDALFKNDNYTATSIKLTNNTKFRVVLDDSSSKCTIVSMGPVEDYGSGNTISYK